jgi:hydrophobic/amphiphilic exporter-1 (mainly G- bacteria), HAE1 family
MRFARFFVDRPIFATVLSVLITLIGGIAYLNLPVAQYPEIAPPTIVVRATYPGADAETVAATVAAPLEEQINGVEGMLYMSSYSSADGAMSLTITFRLGTDLNAAQVLVQNRVSTAIPRLPTPVTQLGVTTNKSSPDFMMVVHLLSPDESYDQLYVSNYARNRIRDQLLRLDGVGDIIIFGERLYSLRIWLDPDKLAAYGLTPSDVVAAVREQNVQVSGGSLGAQPAPQDNAFQLTVTTQGRFQDPQEFRRIIVRSTREGRIVRLQDVARIELGAQDYATGSYLNGKPAVGIAVFQRPNTNALAGARNVIDQMERLKQDFPKGIEYRIVYNPTDYIQASVDAVYTTLVEAMLLVVLVVIVFLQSWRTAIIPILAIPVSLIGTCAVMAALGYSLNNLTLFGLVLAIGIVVDDAIVVVENIERNIAEGMTPHAAAHRTMDEVGTAVIAIALVLSAVFVPTAFIPGITGQFYRQFALTIAVSTVISAFVSLTLSPALAALLLKPHDPHHRSRNPITRAMRWAADRFNGGFDRMAGGYAGAVGFVARRKVMSLLVYGGLIGLTWWVFGRVPTGFIPPQDQGYIIVVIQLPDGASLSRTETATMKVADIVRKIPGVANTVEITGLNGATFSSSSNSGVVFATLKPFSERAGNPGQRDLAIIGQVMQGIGGIEEAFVIAVPPPPVRGLGNQGGFKIQLQDRDGADIRRVLASAYAMMGAAAQTPGLVGVFTTFSANTPQVYLEIDRTKAQMLNVPIGAIFEALQNNLGSAYVNDFNAFGRVYQVRLSADARFRVERDNIARLRVRSADGTLVPLGTLVEIKDVAGPSLVQRYNMYTSVPLQGNAAPGVATGTALSTMERLARQVLPPGIGFEWTELAYQERTTGNTAIFIFALSVVFVFLVLAAQYESWALPLAIVLIVPMSVMSALLGVMTRGMDNNVLTQIGLVVLIGLAAKNAILIVEFARQAEDEGKDPLAAVIEACRLRLRPILMTAFAFILGVVPLAFASGAGAEMRQALGTAVLFGMIGVTFFGLFLTPVFYVALRWLVLKVRPRPKPPQEEPAASP